VKFIQKQQLATPKPEESKANKGNEFETMKKQVFQVQDRLGRARTIVDGQKDKNKHLQDLLKKVDQNIAALSDQLAKKGKNQGPTAENPKAEEKKEEGWEYDEDY
jgi:predicted RNase H-like nuclease (RuvC/YqgF family)